MRSVSHEVVPEKSDKYSAASREAVGCLAKRFMKSVRVGLAGMRKQVAFMGRNAVEDGDIILLNRVKPHTFFHRCRECVNACQGFARSFRVPALLKRRGNICRRIHGDF